MKIEQDYHVEIDHVDGNDNPVEAEQTPDTGGEKQKTKKGPLRDFAETVLIALVIALLIRTFIFQPFYVPTTSMVPTLKVNDRIIVNEIGLRFGSVERGDVMVFKYPLDPELNYVKRIIGMPGDTLEIREHGVYINGELLEEPYLPEDFSYSPFGPVDVPQGSFFTMGDNRPFSQDSRSWGFVPEENMVGEAVLIYWPFSSMGRIR